MGLGELAGGSLTTATIPAGMTRISSSSLRSAKLAQVYISLTKRCFYSWHSLSAKADLATRGRNPSNTPTCCSASNQPTLSRT